MKELSGKYFLSLWTVFSVLTYGQAGAQYVGDPNRLDDPTETILIINSPAVPPVTPGQPPNNDTNNPKDQSQQQPGQQDQNKPKAPWDQDDSEKLPPTFIPGMPIPWDKYVVSPAFTVLFLMPDPCLVKPDLCPSPELY